MPIHFEPPWCRPFCSCSRWRQRLHQLLEAAERFDQLLLLIGEMLLGKPPQPFLRKVGDVDRAFARQRFDALEDMRKNLVEAVDMALVLHQRRTGQIVKTLDVELHQARIHALEQRQIFAQRDGNAGSLQFEEERDEHGRYLAPIEAVAKFMALLR